MCIVLLYESLFCCHRDRHMVGGHHGKGSVMNFSAPYGLFNIWIYMHVCKIDVSFSYQVKERCHAEWAMFRDRMTNAERDYYFQAFQTGSFNSTNWVGSCTCLSKLKRIWRFRVSYNWSFLVWRAGRCNRIC